MIHCGSDPTRFDSDTEYEILNFEDYDKRNCRAMEAMAMPLLQLPVTASPSSSSSSSSCYSIPKLPIFSKKLHHRYSCRPTKSRVVVLVGSNEEATEPSVSSTQEEPDPQDLEYIRQIKRVSFIFLFYEHSCPCFCLLS